MSALLNVPVSQMSSRNVMLYCCSILASQLRADWSVTLERLDTLYYVTWGSSGAGISTAAGDVGKGSDVALLAASGGSLPPQGKRLGKLGHTDFKQVIAKGMKTYGKC